MTSHIPPLPDPAEMVAGSAWLGSREGLREAVAHWLTVAPGERAKLKSKADHLAEPSLGWASLSAVARTGGRVINAVGVDGITEIFRAATDARRVRDGREPKHRGEQEEATSAVEHAQRLVAAGGPAYVKLGQFIASARGLLPDEWVDAFAWCRDEVPPLARGRAEVVIAEAFGRTTGELFATFDPEPIAAASIAQVHKATLIDGTDVVVKVRRPGLRRLFVSDIRVMALLFSAAERVLPEARAANLSGFVELFAQIVLEELDFRLEATNIAELALVSENAGHDYVNYPRPIPDLIARNVLVMERVPGVRYTDALEAYPGLIDGDRLLRLAIQSVIEQTLIYGKFHGDLHAGNVFVAPDGGFSLVDFGIIGRLTASQRSALGRFMVGFAQSNVRSQLEAMRGFGAIPPTADLDHLAAELQVHADQLALLELSSQTMSRGLSELTESIRAMIRLLTGAGFVVPKELVLFFKNLLYLNGFAAALAPDVDLLAEIEPIFGYFAAKYPQAIQAMSPGADAG